MRHIAPGSDSAISLCRASLVARATANLQAMRVASKWATVDSVVAVALAAASQLEIWSPRVVPGVGDVLGNRPVLAVPSLGAPLPLAARRRWPLGVLVVVIGALSLQQALTIPTEG